METGKVIDYISDYRSQGGLLWEKPWGKAWNTDLILGEVCLAGL